MPRSAALDGFQLAYDRHGEPGAPPVVLLHGWPGDRTDMAAVAAELAGTHDVVVPDLRGFGGSDRHDRDPADAYGAAAQAASVAALLDELGLSDVVAGGYDVGSRVAQQLAGDRPELLRALVVTPPAPGVGQRILEPDAVREFWYQAFHQLDLAEELVDGDARAVRAYLRHFWTHWSGPGFVPGADRIEALAAGYAAPGAFVASIAWYRSGGGAVARSLAETVPGPDDRIGVPTTFLWPEHDPLFPRAWSDRLGEFFTDVAVTWVDGAGHFVPVEAPADFAAAVATAARR
ncbi:alpha/beta fold hydrolase [Pseudonocardia sp. HH130630-07]|uniref:alpha/beta fold hydrolase n=1 Tax=Pseudonocardia sp. HH130630-07 TaxID=1690815 RepID=UPI000814BE54|nr:alpha/beta hydrolase [Pseudonocardia sp. HH130630-07]ANY09615.1 epoxide hydrolase [Pseudonocardia sp. HH130630-07]